MCRWEIVVIIHKLLTSIIVTIYNIQGAPDIASGALVGFQASFISVQAMHRPYPDLDTNLLEVGLKVIELINMLLAYNYSVDFEDVTDTDFEAVTTSGSEMPTHWSVFLMLVNVVPVFIMLVLPLVKNLDPKTLAKRLWKKFSAIATKVCLGIKHRPLLPGVVTLATVVAIASSVLADAVAEDKACGFSANSTSESSECIPCPPGEILLADKQLCRTCVRQGLTILALVMSMSVIVPTLAYIMNVFQKWMTLSHSADTDAARDAKNSVSDSQAMFKQVAAIAAVISHLQITKLQFSINIAWPPFLLAMINMITWPFVSQTAPFVP